MGVISRIRPHVLNRFGAETVEIPSWLKSNLVAYYTGTRLNGWANSTDAKWYDSSGNGRHGTLTNFAYAPGSTLDQYGAMFDGVDDFISIADSPALRLTTGGTLWAWIKPINLGEGDRGRILDKSTNSDAANGYRFIMYSNNALLFEINAGINLISIANAITLNKWQLAAVTFNSSGRRLYVNGVDVTSSGGAETALPPDVAGSIIIGNITNSTSYTFNGTIGLAGIATRALTASEIKYLFDSTRRRYGI